MRSLSLVCALLATLASPALAGDTFRLGRWTGFVEAGYDRTDEVSLVGAAGESPLFERDRFEQKLGLRNRLTVVDPSVLEVRLGVTLGFLQHDFGAASGEASGDGRLAGFDVDAGFFRERRFSLDLLANRYESVVPQEFAGTVDIESRNYGATLRMRRVPLPGSLSYRDTEIGTSASSDPQLRGRDERRRSLVYLAERGWDGHRLTLRSELADLTDRLFPTLDHERYRAAVRHTWDFRELVVGGPPSDPELRRPGTLTSYLSVSDRSGDFGSSTFDWTETLRLRHREKVSSSVLYQRRGFDTSAGRSDTERVAIAYRHGLYESLQTETRLESRRTDFDNGGSDEVEARFDADYVKRIPGGELRLGLDLGLLTTDDRFDGGETFVSRESHVARFGEPFRLDRPNVVPASVVVTDESGATVFLEGVDYTLVLVGPFVEITVIPGGGIADATAVLVDYRAEVAPRIDFETVTSHGRAALDFGWIEPFASWQRREERVTSGVDIGILDDLAVDRRGVVLRWRRLRWNLSATNALETRRSRLLAYESASAVVQLGLRPHRAWSTTVTAERLETDFTLPRRETRRESVRVQVEWRPRPGMSLEAFGGTRDWRDTLSADEEFENAGLRARVRLGHLHLSAAVTEWTRRRGDAEFRSTRATLQLTRRFLPGRPPSTTAPRPRSGPWMGDLENPRQRP